MLRLNRLDEAGSAGTVGGEGKAAAEQGWGRGPGGSGGGEWAVAEDGRGDGKDAASGSCGSDGRNGTTGPRDGESVIFTNELMDGGGDNTRLTKLGRLDCAIVEGYIDQ